jgi:hypothetical protein
MEILRTCKELGFRAQHGGTYLDPLTGKDRQFDIRAEWGGEERRFCLAVECKNQRPNLPLLVSRVPRQAGESVHELIHAENGVPNRRRIGGTSAFFAEGQPVGKHLVSLGRILVQGKGGKGPVVADDKEYYDRWGQCISSAAGLVQEICEAPRRPMMEGSRTPGANSASVVLPILVVPNGRLWTADYDESGNLSGQPEEAHLCHYYLNKEVPRRGLPSGAYKVAYVFSHVLICTVSGLRDFLGGISTTKNDAEVRDGLIPRNFGGFPPA